MNSTSDLHDRSAVAEKPGRPRRFRLAFLSLGAFALAGAGGVTWWSVADSRISAVEVAAVGNGVSCREGNVITSPGEELALEGPLTSEAALAPAVEATPGLECSVQLVVINTGDSEVRLNRLVVPVMGPRAAGAVQIVNVSPFGDVLDTAYDESVDAVVELDTALGAGKAQRITLHLAFRPGGCGLAGSVTTPGGPFVHVSALGRTAVHQPPVAPFSFVGTAASECSVGG